MRNLNEHMRLLASCRAQVKKLQDELAAKTEECDMLSTKLKIAEERADDAERLAAETELRRQKAVDELAAMKKAFELMRNELGLAQKRIGELEIEIAKHNEELQKYVFFCFLLLRTLSSPSSSLPLFALQYSHYSHYYHILLQVQGSAGGGKRCSGAAGGAAGGGAVGA